MNITTAPRIVVIDDDNEDAIEVGQATDGTWVMRLTDNTLQVTVRLQVNELAALGLLSLHQIHQVHGSDLIRDFLVEIAAEGMCDESGE